MQTVITPLSPGYPSRSNGGLIHRRFGEQKRQHFRAFNGRCTALYNTLGNQLGGPLAAPLAHRIGVYSRAPVLRKLKPDLFAEDFKFIRYLGASTGLSKAGLDLLDFRHVNLGKRSFWRISLRIRLSSRKASRLAQQLFAQEIVAGRESRFGSTPVAWK